MDVHGTPITICTVHLLTPREGLTAVRSTDIGGLGTLTVNTADRVVQSEKLAADIAGMTGPIIVAGDLNATPTSMVMRTLEGTGLSDAFSEAGWGYGYTYGQFIRLHHSYLRIDHILTSKDFFVKSAWVGGGEGSDHRPVMADLILSENKQH